MSDRNVQIVQTAYAAFGRGDIPALLEMVSDDVEWHAVKGAEGVAPHAGRRHGRAAVAEFFAQLAGGSQFTAFEPREFIASGDQVAVVGYYEAVITATGRRHASDWVMVFTLRDGRIVRFREWTDSAALVRAFGAAAGV